MNKSVLFVGTSPVLAKCHGRRVVDCEPLRGRHVEPTTSRVGHRPTHLEPGCEQLHNWTRTQTVRLIAHDTERLDLGGIEGDSRRDERLALHVSGDDSDVYGGSGVDEIVNGQRSAL